MDRKARIAAEDVLREYRLFVSRARRNRATASDRREAVQAANKLLPKVNRILLALVPDIEPISAMFLPQHEAAIHRIDRADEILGDWDGMVDVRPDGVESSRLVLPLNALDMMIQEGAWDHWNHGKYRQAVADAAGKLNEFTQNRLDRHDIYDSDLMAQAFSDKAPAPGCPRLRCPGDPEDVTVRSMQEGAKLFAMGAFMALRNPAVHWTRNGNPTMAFEQLAALSVIAHWVRYWDVVK